MGLYQEMFESLLKEHFTDKRCIELAIDTFLPRQQNLWAIGGSGRLPSW